MRKNKVHIPVLAALMALLVACNPTKRVPQGEYLLVRNIIRSDAKALTTDELKNILKQKPNNKVLGQRFYLHLYNLSDPEKTVQRKAEVDSICAAKNAERAEKTAAKNVERVARGKEPKPVKVKECRRTLRVWAREDVGEAPVILDSALIERSRDQLEMYLHKEGYFNATVTDTVLFNRTKLFSDKRGKPYAQPKAEVIYRIQAGTPYTVCTWRWTVDDPRIDSLLQATASATLLDTAMRFDADVLDLERTRINTLLRQQGYLFFSRDLMHYDADTSAGIRQVDLDLQFSTGSGHEDRGLTDTPQGTVYSIEDVSLNMAARPSYGGIQLPTDTTEYAGIRFYFDGKKPSYRPKALYPSIQLRPGDRFDQAINDRTYRRLTNLRVFDRVDILFDTISTNAPALADCRITVVPSKRQSLALESFITNRGGFGGSTIGLNYRHKNLFRSMGSIDARITLGVEAQQRIFGSTSITDATAGVGQGILFNTIEFGPDITVRFPRFLIPFFNSDERWPKTWGRRTSVGILYNFQRRPDYTRTLGKLSFGYEWNKSRTLTMALYPADINIIRIPKMSAGFLDFIRTSNDAVLRDSYTDHAIVGARATVTLNTQGTNQGRNVYFWRPSVQTSGNLLSLANKALGMEQQTDTAGNSYYTVAGVRFAQFVKVENDMRLYHTIHSKSRLAFRVAAGVGVPYGNLDVLPFESSFFGGGANSQRAWRARSLGPGSYSAPLDAYDRVGEVELEGNAEYRFKLIGYLEGALFCDVGNIWDLQENPAKPGSGFKLRKVPGELAVGTGMGIRLNFDFFLVRFDFGLQTKDPALPRGERWIFQPKTEGLATPFDSKIVFNLGIGYPF